MKKYWRYYYAAAEVALRGCSCAFLYLYQYYICINTKQIHPYSQHISFNNTNYQIETWICTQCKAEKLNRADSHWVPNERTTDQILKETKLNAQKTSFCERVRQQRFLFIQLLSLPFSPVVWKQLYNTLTRGKSRSVFLPPSHPHTLKSTQETYLYF